MIGDEMEVRGGGGPERSSLLGRAEPIKVNILLRILRAIARLFFPCCFPNAQQREAIEEGRVRSEAVQPELGRLTQHAARRVLNRGGAVNIADLGLEAPVAQNRDHLTQNRELLTQVTAFERSCSTIGTHPHPSLFREADLKRLEEQIEASEDKLATLRAQVASLESADAQASMNPILDRSEDIILQKTNRMKDLEKNVDQHRKLVKAAFQWDEAKATLLRIREEVGSPSESFIDEVVRRYEAKAIATSAQELSNSLQTLMPKGLTFSQQYQRAQFAGGTEALNEALDHSRNLVSQYEKDILDFQESIEIRTKKDLQRAHARVADLEAKLKNLSAPSTSDIPKIKERTWVDLRNRGMTFINDLAATRKLTNEEMTILAKKQDALSRANANLALALKERGAHWDSAPIEALPYMKDSNKLKYPGDSPWITQDQSYLEAIAIAEEAAKDLIDYLMNHVSSNAERERSLSNLFKSPSYSNDDRKALARSYQLEIETLEKDFRTDQKSFEGGHIKRVGHLKEISLCQQDLDKARSEITTYEIQAEANRRHLLDLRNSRNSEMDQMRELEARMQAQHDIQYARHNIGKEPFEHLRGLCQGKLREEVGIGVLDIEKAAGDQKYFELIPGITGLPFSSAEAFASDWCSSDYP